MEGIFIYSVRHAPGFGEIAFLLNIGIFDLFLFLGAVDDCVLSEVIDNNGHYWKQW